MIQPLACLPITQSVIQKPIISKFQWERTLTQASRQCMRENKCGACQIKKCLDACLLDMLYSSKQEALCAMKYIYPLYFKDLVRWVQEQGCEEIMEAEDIVQTVLIDFFVRAQKVKITLQQASLITYLFHAVKNRWIDKTRAKSFSSTTINDFIGDRSDPNYATVEQELEKQKQIYDFLQKIFPRINDNCGKIMRYYFFKLMSYEEIMQTEVGESYSSVEALRNKVHSCSEKFKRILADETLRKEFAQMYDIQPIKMTSPGDSHGK